MTKPNPQFQKRFWWEMAGVLTMKVLGLTLLYALFFAPAQRTHVNAPAMAQHLVSPAPLADNNPGGGTR